MPADALIVQITDLHLQPQPTDSYRGFDLAARLQQVLAEIERRFERVDLLLLTGDLTHHGESATYDWLAAQVDGVAGQLCWIPGNHDVAEYMAGPLWQQALRLAGWQILLLDSTSEPDGRGSGALADSELAMLQQQLAHNSQPALVVLHHNPLATGSAWQDAVMLSNAPQFWQALAGYDQVRAVLHGHIHQQFAQCQGAVQVLGTPAIAPQFKPQQADFTLEDNPAHSGPAFRWLRLGADGQLTTDIVRL